MTTNNFDRLRYSFDNILKELDDIYQSIDKWTELTNYDYERSSHNSSRNFNNRNQLPTSSLYSTLPSNKWQQLPTQSSQYSPSSTAAASTPLPPPTDQHFVSSSSRQPIRPQTRSITTEKTINVISSPPLFKNDYDQNYQNLNCKPPQPPPQPSASSSSSSKRNRKHHRQHRQQEQQQQHRQDDLTVSINDIVGSVQENIISNSNLFPMTTSNNNKKNDAFYNFNRNYDHNNNNPSFHTQLQQPSSFQLMKNQFKSVGNVNEDILNVLNEKFELPPPPANLDDEYDDNEKNHDDETKTSPPLPLKNKNNISMPNIRGAGGRGEGGETLLPIKGEKTTNNNNDSFSQSDCLNEAEIDKITSFYSSLNCIVYVSRCLAEIYQIKRENEFDFLDNDPVNDYFAFKEQREQAGAESGVEVVESNYKINYTYINSGVPVIVFNYGGLGSKRKVDLRLLLVERDTGFCLWEFKFNRLTRYKNPTNATIFRLTAKDEQTNNDNNSNVDIGGGLNSRKHRSSSANNNSMNRNRRLPSSPAAAAFAQQYQHHSNRPSFCYHNEYFEKFFNGRRRHAYKEHLIKFVIKSDCDEFCLNLRKIMNDKRFKEFFDVINQSMLLPVADNHEHHYHHHNTNSVISSSSRIQADDTIFEYANEYFNLNADFPISSSLIITHFNFAVDSGGAAAENHQDAAVQETNSYASSRKAAAAAPNQHHHQQHQNNLIMSKLNSSASSSNLDKFAHKKHRKKLLNISEPKNFNHISHLDKPVAIGKRYLSNY